VQMQEQRKPTNRQVRLRMEPIRRAGPRRLVENPNHDQHTSQTNPGVRSVHPSAILFKQARWSLSSETTNDQECQDVKEIAACWRAVFLIHDAGPNKRLGIGLLCRGILMADGLELSTVFPEERSLPFACVRETAMLIQAWLIDSSCIEERMRQTPVIVSPTKCWKSPIIGKRTVHAT